MASPCRFCLERTQTKEDPFIQPCSCKGSVKNVHLLCLLQWRDVTENPEAKYKCQICASIFNFPTRWKRQVDLLYKSVIWYILQKQYVFLVLTQILHTSIVCDTGEFRYYIEDYTTEKSKRIFQGLLLSVSSVYATYYYYLWSNVTEKEIYSVYAQTKQNRLVLLLTILSLSFGGTFLHLFPFGYVYVSFIPYVIQEHGSIIAAMNNDCEIIKAS
jgi:hypothetical protein